MEPTLTMPLCKYVKKVLVCKCMHIFAKGFTFGSVVNHQLVGLSWSRPNEILVIISWTLILLNFLVYCFPDSAPTYQDLKGELLS